MTSVKASEMYTAMYQGKAVLVCAEARAREEYLPDMTLSKVSLFALTR